MSYLLGIDVGTTSCKVLAAEPNGREWAAAEREYPLREPTPGFRQQDPAELYRAVEAALREVTLTMRTSHPTEAPVALGVSAAMHSLMAVGAAGQPLTPLITWADTRAHAYA
ncbi:MAG: FGGY family carbohydrate kinase, partial [Catalinimonas sp.]